MVVSQCLVGLDNMVKISVHKFIHDVDIVEALFLRWPYDIFDCNYLLRCKKNEIHCYDPNIGMIYVCSHIVMIHVAQKFYFSQRPLCINPVIKCIANLLNGYLFTCLGVYSSAEAKR